MMKVNVEKEGPNNMEELKTAIQVAWDNIDQSVITNLYDSIQNRLNLCIEKNGNKIPC